MFFLWNFSTRQDEPYAILRNAAIKYSYSQLTSLPGAVLIKTYITKLWKQGHCLGLIDIYPAEENSAYIQHASALVPNLLFLLYYNFPNFHNIIFNMCFGGFIIPNTMGDCRCHDLHSSRFPCRQRLASCWEFLAKKLHNYGDNNNIPQLGEGVEM